MVDGMEAGCWECYQGIRYGYHFVSIVSIYSSIAQYAAVALAADGTAVAVFVAGRSADEGDIDMSFAGFNGSYAAAVAAHDGQTLQFAVADCLADFAAHAGRLNVGDGAIFNVGNDRIIGFARELAQMVMSLMPIS